MVQCSIVEVVVAWYGISSGAEEEGEEQQEDKNKTINNKILREHRTAPRGLLF